MFIIKERNYPILNSNYKLNKDGELENDTNGGGEELYLDKDNWHIFIDLNKETFECYSITVRLVACRFSIANYKMRPATDGTLYYQKTDNLNRVISCEDFDIKCYVDLINKLILIGDINADGECYQFFKDTYCILSKNNVKLFFIKVDDSVLNFIQSQQLK